jgi:SagB-type dehydrogenase family enzyme
MSVIALANGDVSLASPLGTLTYRRSANLLPAFRRLANPGATLDELADLMLTLDAAASLYRLYLHVEQLSSRGMLEHTVVDRGRPVATIAGIGRGYRFATAPLDTAQRFVLSRFAYLRRDAHRVVLECPIGRAQVRLEDPRAAELVALLSEQRSVLDLVERIDTGEDLVAGCYQLLRNAAALSPVTQDGQPAEDSDPARAQWDFHDLLFHARSRFGRHSEPFGATFRRARTTRPLPAVRSVPDAAPVALPAVDLAQIASLDPPLTQAIEERRSIRTHGDTAITLTQLGEFLYRVARVRSSGSIPVQNVGGSMEVTSRPYPAGGTCYELEFYLVVDRCIRIDRGIYHYDPANHRLGPLQAGDTHVEALLRYAGIAAGGARPQILVILAARFGRVSWKYDSIAYATTLKHVGVLVQTMYLVATAMGLAGCALGSGDPDAFCDAVGTDYLREGSVGEFMLGTLPPEETRT